MTKTMAEVLAEHWSASTHSDRKPFVDKCDGCGAVIMTWGEGGDMPALLVAHQAAALSAAGFGLVAGAGAKALEDAADSREVDLATGVELFTFGLQTRLALRARAVAVRGEG